MHEIVLTTLNARYWHTSFGLRYLYANLGELQSRATVLEFGISEQSVDIIARVLEERPVIVGIGVYIWNVDQVERLVRDLRRVRPQLKIVVGGPEVSYETETLSWLEDVDHVICGEADHAFTELCETLLSSESSALPPEKILRPGIPDLKAVELPYSLYTDEDIAHRVIYVEISRGCPFTCEFCLSALDIPVRLFDVDEFLAAMKVLLDRGARQFKFVDRTFNLNIRISTRVLQFFLDEYTPGLFLHFEMIPDRLPDSLRDLIRQFPDGALQFEIGVQTFNDQAGELISRRQDNEALEQNFRFLRQETGAHIHADLIVGLPGEDVDSFAAGFDRLVALEPQEIQVGILKRLKGTPITRHDADWNMTYSSAPPYEILSNGLIDFETMQRLRRFAKYWDTVANSGNLRRSVPLIWQDRTPFYGFMEFCEWLYSAEGRTHSIALKTLISRTFTFLTEVRELLASDVAESLLQDYASGGRRDIPDCLRPHIKLPADRNSEDKTLPVRQRKHLSRNPSAG